MKVKKETKKKDARGGVRQGAGLKIGVMGKKKPITLLFYDADRAALIEKYSSMQMAMNAICEKERATAMSQI